MKIQTYSILAGSEACNARCSFCISKMTPPQGVELKEPEVNWRNFRKGALLAKQGGVTTAMITGKGEPTLFPKQISKYLAALEEFQFPFIELQTNGIQIAENKERYNHFLEDWYNKGLTTVAVSIVHYDQEKNRQIYLPYKKSYIDLPDLIENFHDKGLSVRLTAIMLDGFIDNVNDLEKLIQFSLENKVEQLSVSPVNKTDKDDRNPEVYRWILKNYLKPEQEREIRNYLEEKGIHLMDLMHGTRIYDVNGQNVGFKKCLTIEPNSGDIRQLIFFPDGHLRYDWQYEGAILI